MRIAPWLLSVLWREHDWPGALDRCAQELRASEPGPESLRAATELAQACEYIVPDRRRVLAVHELAGETTRARELAIELGWWAAAARLAARDNDRLAEAEAWWDAGQRELSALAIAGVRDSSHRVVELRALLAGQDLADQIAARGDSPDTYVTAARFALASGRAETAVSWLEAALALDASHAVAARHLLSHAIEAHDHDQARRYLQLRLDGVDRVEWLDATRACALALVDVEQHRGFGLRLLRHTLERAYERGDDQIPGHLAMWGVLAEHAAQSNTRRELLPLAVTAIETAKHDVDRVWVAALATEIALRDANHPVVAGAYADIVAQHAPEHPMVKELVAHVAANQQSFDIDLDEVPASDSATLDAADLELIDPGLMADVVSAANAASTAPAPAPLPPRPAAPPKPIAPVMPKPAPKTMPLAKVAPVSAPRELPPLSKALPSTTGKVLAALRKPNRPTIPPRPADPPDAIARARRIAIPIDVRIALADGQRIEAHTRDVSTSGIYAMTSASLAVGTEVELALLIPGKEAFTEEEHHCRGRVVREAEEGYGIELVAPDAALVAALDAL